MSAKRDGGPAFPESVAADNMDGLNYSRHPGMSLRDWFAGQALASVIHLTQSRDGSWDPVAVAAGCYLVADAMLDAREKGGAP